MPALNLPYSIDEACRLGEEIYERDIRAKVEKDHFGEVLVLDIESGDYEIDENHLDALTRLKARRPESVCYALRVGYPALAKIGGSWGKRYL
jgi:hypothetical protein